LYDGCTKSENAAHIFGISDSAYHSMLQLSQNQCIVISGESGSGKTESAKYLIQHLTKLGRVSDAWLFLTEPD
jgi:myosin III